MRIPAILVLVLLVTCAALTAVFSQEGASPAGPGDPRDLGIVEQTGRRLVQVDVTVTGPAKVVDTLTAEDFQVVVDGTLIEEFTLDRLCMNGPAPTQIVEQGGFEAGDTEQPVPTAPPPPRVSYFFYYDQHHLTMPGRERAIDLSRDLVRELITGDAQAMIVSSGLEIRVFSDFTSDPQVLLAALDRLEKDPTQFDPFPSQEDGRVAEVYSALGMGIDAGNSMARMSQQDASASSGASASLQRQQSSLDSAPIQGFGRPSNDMGRAAGAMSRQSEAAMESAADMKMSGIAHGKTTARFYQREEKWHTELALSRFSTMLGRLDGINPPKAVLYFADRMRSNAGDHYIRLFGERVGDPDPRDPTNQVLAGASSPMFDQLIDEAAIRGARVYTVQAEGLVSGMSGVQVNSASIGMMSGESLLGSARFTDAKNALVGLAAETGGQAFLNGVGPSKIATRIESDLDCIYLISFDAQGFARDRRMPLIVHVTKPKVTARTRARLMVQSDSAQLASRLNSAFTNPERVPAERRLSTSVIPTGFADGKYSALVQVRVPGSEFGSAVWDVGLSGLSRGRLKQQTSTRVSVSQPGVPMVFEAQMEFSPGPYELTAVAHDLKQDTVVSGRVEGEWPDPRDHDATVGPIALVQPADAVFVRDGVHRTRGSMARADDERIRADLPAALLAIVCVDRGKKDSFKVDRQLEGDSVAGFPLLDVPQDDERCFLFSDLVRAGTMTEGQFQYAVRVLHDDQEIAKGARAFIAVAPQPVAAEPPPADM